MQIFDRIIGGQVEKRDLIIFFCLVLLAVFTQGAAVAQQQPSRFEATGLDKPAQDIALAGTVDQLGPLLTVNGPQGSFTANLGRNLSPQERQSLTQGTPVQLTGVMDATGCLLARTITVGGKQITLRNGHGFAVYPQGHKNNLSGGVK